MTHPLGENENQGSVKDLYFGARFIRFVLVIVETLLLIRFFLRLLGANPGATFTALIYSLTGTLIRPFQYVFGSSTALDREVVVEWNTLLAILVYWLVAWGLIGLMTLRRPVSKREARHDLRSQDITRS